TFLDGNTAIVYQHQLTLKIYSFRILSYKMIDIEELIGLIERLEASDELSLSEDKIITSLNHLIESCHIPRIDHSEDVPYTVQDFGVAVKSAETQLIYISRYFGSLCTASDNGRNFSNLFKRNVVVNCLLLASEFTEADCAWSNSKLAHASQSLIRKICHFCKVDKVSQILICNNASIKMSNNDVSDSLSDRVIESPEGYLNLLLQNLAKKCNKNMWKKYPAKVHSYYWILTLLDHHSLGDNLSYLLPPALFILDDWEKRHKILGLNCLSLILKNTSSSELRWFGRAAVIYDAIKPIMFSREPDILELFYPVCFDVIKALDTDPKNTEKFKKITLYDIIMQQLLREMAHEQKIALRKIYIQILHQAISYMGIYIVRWTDEIIEVSQDYAATYDGPKAEDRIQTVKVLQIYVQQSWPQVHVVASKILKIIVRLLYDVTLNDPHVEKESVDEVFSECCALVKLLKAVAPRTTRDLCRGIETIHVNSMANSYIQEIKSIVTS
ncbi:unnamed protein product, partial [Meganyctiphanes norvegica]